MGIDPKVVGRPMCDGKKGDVEPVAVDMDIEPVWAAKIESGQFLTRNFNGVLSRYVHVSPRTRSSAFDLCSAWGPGAEVVRHPWHPERDGRGPGVASETVHGPGFPVTHERDMMPRPIIAADETQQPDVTPPMTPVLPAAPPPAFQKGDVVTLRSGGPKMTVVAVYAEGVTKCAWFRGPCGDELAAEMFTMAALVKCRVN